MNRAITVRATALILVGLFLIAAGAAGQARPQPQPKPVQSWRPATEQERQQRDRQLLVEELDRLWQQRQEQGPR